MADTIALMWDCNGLESAVNLDEINRKRTWNILQDKNARTDSMPNLMHWKLRAQANMQRHYEIYIVSIDGVTVDDLVKAFQDAPQQMADTVRSIGVKFYSDRADEEVKIR